eukprot:CAMPEP_0206425002 /NCGR_PEP_ID=MMETSP0324_2-20121206/3545_1 /ASSEMBLY_ACC=CAM_ASM_000836 /TAXON_ID=2866 /ORGANISM="Crypthecodinium cohnii, Strain Seligo" /LENGTH=274 /DNA_ID=CAMNT_0053889727 /DNA_START=47 /DNA_END=871 /DNA_ORIENTATION=-
MTVMSDISPTNADKKSPSRSLSWRVWTLGAFVGLAALVPLLIHIGKEFNGIHHLDQDLEVAGQVGIFLVCFVLLFMAMIPSTMFELFAGYYFGLPIGITACVLAQPIAHTSTFLFARRVGVLGVAGKLRERVKVFEAVELAMKEDVAAAWQTVFLLCLAMLPAGPKMYALATVSSVPAYMIPPCAIAACAPQTVVNVWFGSKMKDIRAIFDGSSKGTPEEQRVQCVILAVNILALFAAMGLITLYAKRALKKLTDRAEGADEERGDVPYVRICD